MHSHNYLQWKFGLIFLMCREDGKNPHPGQTLYLYTGMRTKSCRKLREETCRESLPVYMDAQENGMVDVFIGGDLLSSADVEKLAVADGFDSSDEFIKFFSCCLPFKGYLILW